MLLLHGVEGKRRRDEAIALAIERLRDFRRRTAAGRRKGWSKMVHAVDDDAVLGGSLEGLLAETGERDEVYGEAIKRVLAWRIETARRERSLSKSEVASRMGTSRSPFDRVIDPANAAVSLETLDRAARAVGKRLIVEIVDDA